MTCFDPDPETRALAALGNAERHLAQLDPHAQAHWLWDFATAAELFKDSPKWTVVGQAMSDTSDRLWLYADVDTLVISLWPLVKQYNWTYRDLLKVVRSFVTRPDAYPCEHEQGFATYCNQVLGLRKTGKGASAKNGWPEGYEIAKRFVLPLKEKDPKDERDKK